MAIGKRKDLHYNGLVSLNYDHFLFFTAVTLLLCRVVKTSKYFLFLSVNGVGVAIFMSLEKCVRDLPRCPFSLGMFCILFLSLL